MDPTGRHQTAPPTGRDRRIDPGRAERGSRLAASTGLVASTGLASADVGDLAHPETEPRRRLLLDAAVVLGTVAALLLAASFIFPPQPTGGVLGITSDADATAATIVGADPAAGATDGAGTGSAVTTLPTLPGVPLPSAPTPRGSFVTAPIASALSPCPDRSGCYLYTIRRGDTLSAIATRFGVSVAAILALNPTIANPSVITAGREVRIPTPTR